MITFIYIVIGLLIVTLLFFLRIGYINKNFQNTLKEGDYGYVWVDDMKVPCHVSRIDDLGHVFIKVGNTTEFEWDRNQIYVI
jgi:hypothetical protein